MAIVLPRAINEKPHECEAAFNWYYNISYRVKKLIQL